MSLNNKKLSYHRKLSEVPQKIASYKWIEIKLGASCTSFIGLISLATDV